MKILLTLLVALQLYAGVVPLSKFEFLNNGIYQNFKNQKIIVIQINKNYAGWFYYVQNGKITHKGQLSSGSASNNTPEGIYNIYYKIEKFMSTKYPDPSGINNMDYSMFFNEDIAMHKGNINRTSHGCCHLTKKSAKFLYKETCIGTPVIVTTKDYSKFLPVPKKHFFK